MKTIAIIAAAGQSRRMGEKGNKQFIEISGKPVLAFSLIAFQNINEIDNIIIAIEEKNIEYCKKEIVEKFNISKVSNVIAGGKERQDSVYNAVRALPADTKYVMIHDGARPMINANIIKNVLNAAKINGASITVVPVKDTIKENENNFVSRTIDRKRLVSVQTPQAFTIDILKQAYDMAYKENFYGTDDAMLVERLGIPVKIVEGDYCNIKVTTPEDILIAEALIKKQEL